MYNKKMQYVIRTCSSENPQELQNLLNEMSMNGWELYSMNEVESDDGFKFNCIFMCEAKSDDSDKNADVINISTFKSQMEKMLSPELNPYENCIEIQSKIRSQKDNIAKIKKELEGEAPASVGRKKLNDKISAGLKELDELKIKLAKATSPDVMYSRLKEDKLSIHLSEELLDYVDQDADIPEEDLLSETVKSRLKLADELGYVIPKIVFQDDENLNPFEFCIKVRGNNVYTATAYPNYVMFFTDDIHLDKKMKNTIKDVDIVTGKNIIWIEKEKTKDFWEKGINGAEFIARALEYVAVKHVDELLDYNDVEKYVEVVSRKNEFLVENIIPDFINLSDLRFILTSLIKERVSVKDITYIFEQINDYAEDSSKIDLLKKIRLTLSRQICNNYINEDGVMSVFDLTDKTIDSLVESFDETDDVVRINGEFAEKIADKINKKTEQLGLVDSVKLVVPMEYRHLLFTLLSNYVRDIVVLAREEIGCNCQLEILASI